VIRYLLCPSSVASKRDGQTHYISATRLAQLYGVRMDECRIRPHGDRQLGWNENHGLIELWPDYHGDYKLPEPKP
jgi:hypothetical protein